VLIDGARVKTVRSHLSINDLAKLVAQGAVQAGSSSGAAASAGLHVPDDLAVTGWDDSDATAPAGLTSLAQSLRNQGAHCARVALGRPTKASARHEWQVVVRTTTRRPH